MSADRLLHVALLWCSPAPLRQKCRRSADPQIRKGTERNAVDRAKEGAACGGYRRRNAAIYLAEFVRLNDSHYDSYFVSAMPERATALHRKLRLDLR
ncbi:hypothetical protein [Streptomyces tubercidicus]|uniref:hypothetical protein n=1 Tax=Streptomyces tubercidicus TaxID=47759 RepID=UPI0036A90E12